MTVPRTILTLAATVLAAFVASAGLTYLAFDVFAVQAGGGGYPAGQAVEALRASLPVAVVELVVILLVLPVVRSVNGERAGRAAPRAVAVVIAAALAAFPMSLRFGLVLFPPLFVLAAVLAAVALPVFMRPSRPAAVRPHGDGPAPLTGVPDRRP